MDSFNFSIMFLGVLLIAVSLVMIAFDRKRSYDDLDKLSNRKEELVGIIKDAEQMVEELNRFSDYIVTQIDSKSEEITNKLSYVDEKIVQLNIKADSRSNNYVLSEINAAAASEISNKEANKLRSDLAIDSLEIGYEGVSYSKTIKDDFAKKDKSSIISERNREVLKLFQEGLSETDIAKKLHMGKGEIQLIIGMNK